MKKLGQIALIGVLAIYVTMRVLSLCGVPAKTGEGGNGFEFSVAKHREAAQPAQWSVKMYAGTFNLNLNWNP